MKIQICPKCNGDGKVFNRIDSNYENFTSSGVQIPCNFCGGLGYFVEKEVCKDLNWIDINYLKPGRKVKEIVAKFSNGEKKIINLRKQNSLYGDWISEDHKVIHITHWFELTD